MSRHRIVLLVALASAAFGRLHVASAQVVRGAVVDSTTGVPVGAGFVILTDTLGNELVRTLTSADGSFEIRSPRTGFVRLRSERIGYRPWRSPILELNLRETLPFTARVSALPVQLATIETRSENTCRMRSEESEAVSILWEEARKALTAASWNAQQRQYRQTLLSYERDLDRRRRTVQSEKSTFFSGIYEVPYKSRDPEYLATEGYVTYENGANWYYAPDAHILLDERFHTTHCFRVIEGDDDTEGLIGLGFEPARGIDRPDVEGTLWIDVESAELQRIEYSYTGLPRDIRDDRIGGTIEFLPMPTGAWIVHKWQIRTPFVRSETTFGGADRQVLDGFRDTGGEVLVVTTLDGDSVYAAPTALLQGVVVDSSRGDFAQPLRGAVVSIVGTSFSALTGNQGEFRIEAPLSGTYEVGFTHPRLDSLGIRSAASETALEPGTPSHLEIAIGSIATIVQSHCDGPFDPEHELIVVGVARDRYATPVPNAKVHAFWQVVPVINEDLLVFRENTHEVRTDSAGRYALCNIPHDAFVSLTGSKDVNGEELTGSTDFTYVEARSTLELRAPDQLGSSTFVTDPIVKVDITMSRRANPDSE